MNLKVSLVKSSLMINPHHHTSLVSIAAVRWRIGTNIQIRITLTKFYSFAFPLRQFMQFNGILRFYVLANPSVCFMRVKANEEFGEDKKVIHVYEISGWEIFVFCGFFGNEMQNCKKVISISQAINFFESVCWKLENVIFVFFFHMRKNFLNANKS